MKLWKFLCSKLFPAASGVVLMYGTMAEAGFTEVTLASIAGASIYIAAISIVLAFIQVFYMIEKSRREEINNVRFFNNLFS